MIKGSDVLVLDRRRLAEAWYKRAYISIKQHYFNKEDVTYVPSDHLEDILEKHVDEFWRSFTSEWSSHTDNCNHKGIVILSMHTFTYLNGNELNNTTVKYVVNLFGLLKPNNN